MTVGMLLPTDTSTGGGPLKIRVEGMDCSACAIKVENALKRLLGVSQINMNYATETLSLRLDADRTSHDIVESKIRALGYTPEVLGDAITRVPGATTDYARQRGDHPRWKTRKGRMVVGLGFLLACAFAISTLTPELSLWAYG